jgi:lipoprotein-anchoring transpeptidase ErfK/SrfK
MIRGSFDAPFSGNTVHIMKRVAPVLIPLLAAGVFAATVLADTPPPTTTPTTTTTTTTTTPAVVPAGVTLAGVQIGGLAPDVATAAVLEAFEQPVILRFDKTTISVSPNLLGVTVPADAAVAKAMTVVPDTTLALRAGVDKQLVRSFIGKLADRFNREPVSSRLLLRNSKPFVTTPVIGRTIFQSVAIAAHTDELVNATPSAKVLRAQRKQPKVTPATIGPVNVIRRGSNLLTLYNGMKVVRKFGVATGQAVYPTPLGRFQIVVMWKNPWWYPPASPWAQGEKPVPPGPGNPLGTRWMGLSAPGVGIHGTPQDGSIGYSLSHGCIRMHIPQAEWLFEHVKVGTPVFIVAA